jgi:hypothetical protein
MALSSVAWSIWCDGLSSAGVNIKAELRKQLAKLSIKDPEESTEFKYLEAVKHISQNSSLERSKVHQQQWDKVCTVCGSGRDWEYCYQPFDLFGSYLNGESDHMDHAFCKNYSDSSWCSYSSNFTSCMAEDHLGRIVHTSSLATWIR